MSADVDAPDDVLEELADALEDRFTVSGLTGDFTT
jgi:hypothetical protein